MGYKRKAFDKENFYTDEANRPVYKKKKRKKVLVDIQISDLVEIPEELYT